MRILLILLICTSVIAANAQGILRGNIHDRETGEPIIQCNVYLQGTTTGTVTDIDGFFTFTALKAGTYTLIAKYIGYDSLTFEFTLADNAVRYERLYMTASPVQLQTIDISGRRAEQRTQVNISKISVSPKEIRALPSTGGEADIAQYLQVLPGVISTGDQGGQLYIRGGSPVQNKIMLDGMTIYNPFHSIGFFSVFETEVIRSVDVLTGGFGAEHGGRISAIVDVKTREGNQRRYAGLVSASPFQAKAVLEGPIVSFREDREGSASFLLTGKHSYLDRTSPGLYAYATSDSLGLPFHFTDFYAKLSALAGGGSKINVFAFNFNDAARYAGVADFRWNTAGGGLNFRLIPAHSRLLIDGVVAYSDYEVTLREADESPRTSGISGFNAALNFKYFGNQSELDYGLELNGFRTDLRFRNFVGITLNDFNNTTEIAGYVKFRQTAGKLILEPGIRAQYYASLGNFSVEPRFAFKLNMSDHVRFKLSGGLYSQNLISTVSERDIVNLFVGFLSGPEQRIFEPGSTNETAHRLQKAVHGVAGFEFDIGRNVQLNVEPYYKNFTQLIALNRNKLRASDPDFMTETGKAVGLDISMRYDDARTFLWVVYSLGNVTRDDGRQEYRTNFDRRHNFNVLATYRFGLQRQWEFGLRWNAGTGFPFTLTQGFYGQYNFITGLDTDILTGNPGLGLIYANTRNSGLLPAYHRMDISLKRKFELGRHTALEANISVTNVYDRKNIFYFDRVRYQRIDQLPVLPSMGLTFMF